jgi:TRAP-type transport system small permease protein
LTRVLQTARRAVALLLGVAAVLAGACFFAIFVLNVVQIAMRTFGGGGFLWSTDLSSVLFVWMVMLGIAAAYHQRGHIVVDFIVARAHGLSERIIALVVRGVEITVFGVLVYAGTEVAMLRTGISFIQLDAPTSWAFSAVPVGGALMLLSAVVLPLRLERPAVQDDIDDPAAPIPDNGAGSGRMSDNGDSR